MDWSKTLSINSCVLGLILYTFGQVCVSVVADIVMLLMLIHSLVSMLTTSLVDQDEDQIQAAVTIMMDANSQYFSSCGLALNQDKC